MARKQSAVSDWAVYLVVRMVICLFQTISGALASNLVHGLALLVFTLDRRHRRIAIENLRHAFPQRYTEAQLHAIVLATYRHFLMLLADVSQLPRKMHRHNAESFFDKGKLFPEFLELLHSERPLLIVTGHFGNWELAGYALGAYGIRSYAIARLLDNPYLEAFLRRFRQKTGQTVLDKKDLLGIQSALDKGGKVAVLADQSAGHRGVMVDFFGRPASAHKGVATLALQHNAPMAVVGVRKLGDPLRFQLIIEDIIYPDEYTGYRAERVRRITQRFTSALERIIRTAPEQYFWLHNRWKQKPLPAARPQKAA